MPDRPPGCGASVDGVTVLPMFPLGSVLLPAMPLALRVFEPRYLALLADVLEQDEPGFGVVLIERGREVGGGDQRFGVGTVARIAEIRQGDGLLGVVARGATRFAVQEWLADEPYPRARVQELPALAPEGLQRLDEADREVRTALALASEFVDQPWSADIELADDPVEHAWQLAGITPVGTLDRLALLRSSSVQELLDAVLEQTAGAVAAMRAGWSPGDLG